MECPCCQQTEWVRGEPGRDVICPSCGSAVSIVPDRRFRWLAAAVRARFARDVELNQDRPRFVRDPH